MRQLFLKVGLATSLLLTPALLFAQSVAWNVGDVFVAADGNYQVWRNGQNIDTFSGATGQAGGCAFDSQFNLYGTYGSTTTAGQVVEFGHILGTTPIVMNTGVYSESIAFDASGHFYVGSPNVSVLQFTPSLPPTSSETITYSSPTTISTNGTAADQVDLGTDQTNLFFTSSSAFTKTTSTNVSRVDLTNSAGLSVSGKVSGTAWAVKLLTPADIKPATQTTPSPTAIRGMLVAADSSVLRLDSSGKVVKTYTPSGRVKSLRFLALDPDGASFWVADVGNSTVSRINLASGATTASLSVGNKSTIGGVCVLGGQQLNIVPLPFAANSTNVTRVAPFGDPQIDPNTLQPTIDATGQTVSPNYHTWSATIDAVSSAFSLVVSATGEGPQTPVTSTQPFLTRFDQFFCGQAEPGCAFPASGPTLVPIPYVDQVVGLNGIPTVTGSGTHFSPGNRVVYRVANPPATGNIVAAIHYFQPPICVTPFVSPLYTSASSASNCYVPASCPTATSPLFVNSPRFMLAPSEGAGATPDHQFAFDTSINYFRDTGIAGGGGRSDHVVADRCPSLNSNTSCVATAVFNNPLPQSKNKIGSNLPVKVSVTDCNGNAVLGANAAPNAMTISVTGPQDQIETATGQSFQFFTQNGGAGGTYSGNLVTNGFTPGLTQICVTSTNSNVGTTGSGQFVPVCQTVNMVK